MEIMLTPMPQKQAGAEFYLVPHSTSSVSLSSRVAVDTPPSKLGCWSAGRDGPVGRAGDSGAAAQSSAPSTSGRSGNSCSAAYSSP